MESRHARVWQWPTVVILRSCLSGSETKPERNTPSYVVEKAEEIVPLIKLLCRKPSDFYPCSSLGAQSGFDGSSQTPSPCSPGKRAGKRLCRGSPGRRTRRCHKSKTSHGCLFPVPPDPRIYVALKKLSAPQVREADSTGGVTHVHHALLITNARSISQNSQFEMFLRLCLPFADVAMKCWLKTNEFDQIYHGSENSLVVIRSRGDWTTYVPGPKQGST